MTPDDRCICGHEEERHEISGYCAGGDCTCDGFIWDDDASEQAIESMLDHLRGK